MKTIKTTLYLLLLLPTLLLLACSSDDNNNDEDPQDETTSYAIFTISGPVTNNNFEFRDTQNNDFNTIGVVGYVDESLQTPAGVAFTVYKTMSESNFYLTINPTTGTFHVPEYDEVIDINFDLNIIFSHNEVYTASGVNVTITQMEYQAFHLTKLKGTFSGTFRLEDSSGQNLGDHNITGEFGLMIQ